MQIGLIGLGKMGMNMAKRLVRGKHKVVVYNRTPEKTREMARNGARGAYSLEELAGLLNPPRVIWLMLPSGKPVDDNIEALKPFLKKGDTIVDGGNSFYRDDTRRQEGLRPLGINYMDVGVSGGIWGLTKGYCLMVGGEKKHFRRLVPIFRTLAPKDGYLHCGPSGAGHFVKMVHNGIEYGMMSSYGEGFGILSASSYAAHLDFHQVAHLWNQGSVIRSWLLELAEDAFKKDGDLSGLEAYVEDSGEGRWIIQQALDTAVPVPVISSSLFQRFRSREKDPISDRLLAALRKEFGGHEVKVKKAKTRPGP